VAHDKKYSNEFEAEIKVEKLYSCLRKKYTKDVFYYRNRDLIFDYDKGRTALKTLYFGTPNFRLSIYSRISKFIVRQPVLHLEWRIRGAEEIKRKTKIKTLHDLLTFDIKKFISLQAERQLAYEEIDMDKLGKWHMDWTRRRKFSETEQSKIDLAALMICKEVKGRIKKWDGDLYDITYAELDSWFKNEKAKIRKKRSRHSDWERKILATDHSQFRRVVSPPPIIM
jgi:hypothetical protein